MWNEDLHPRVVVQTAPTLEPITLDEVKEHLRHEETEDEAYLFALIRTAREKLEEELGRAFLQQTIDLTLDRFPEDGCYLYLPRSPVVSVTYVKYVDSGGSLVTWDPALYAISLPSVPPRIYPVYGQIWPYERSQMDAVQVRYIAGWGTTRGAVPEMLRLGLKTLIAHLYEYREAEAAIPQAVMNLVQGYRTSWT